ncbi:cytochrome c [Rubripirellula amarantea]|nr:cytochrome c [Rubripirellula amarantea]
MKNSRICMLALLLVATTIGCNVQTEPMAAFEPNLVHAMKYQIQEEIPMAEAARDTHWLAGQMFGTPDDPKLPEVITEDEELASIVAMDNLVKASGPADAEGRGLYRKHCVVCHGITGNGRGPTAAVQVPYPRDYRMGVFKFKSTPRGSKPAKDDFAKLIKHGIGGTAMVKIPELTDSDIDALVDYVIYLSWRGELERQAIDIAIFDGLLGEEGDRIINSDLGNRLKSNPSLRSELEALSEKDEDALTELDAQRLDAFEAYEEAWEYAEDYAVEIGESWLEAQDEVIEVPEPPADVPVAEDYADVLKLKSGEQAEAFLASVKRGQELFRGKVASCSKCHGETGMGDGQTNDYDDWTKDWTTRIGLKPEDRESLIPLLARGAFEPRNALPRNFAEGVFRGGASSEDLYLRITQGIEGSPMPAATFVEGQFEEDDVWHLINYIRSLQTVVPEPEAT